MLGCLIGAVIFGQIPGNVLVGGDIPSGRQSPRSPIHITITGAKAVEVETLAGKQECLQVSFKVENRDAYATLTYYSWGKDFRGPWPATARTASGLKLDSPSATVEGQRSQELIRPKKTLTDILLFEMPPFKEQEVVVTFPDNHFRSNDISTPPVDQFKVTIPRTLWMKSLGRIEPPVYAGNLEPVVSSVASVKVSVVEAVIKPAIIEEATDTAQTKASFLHVKLKVENTTETIPATFNGWERVSAKTNDGKTLKQLALGLGKRVKGESTARFIKQRESIETVLVFDPPGRNTKSIEIRLDPSGACIQGEPLRRDSEWFTFTIPNTFWRDYFRRDDEARNKAIEKMSPVKKGS